MILKVSTRNNDDYGDIPYVNNVYLDTLWMSDDWMRLFFGSPVLSVVNLLARLAPISEPRELLVDKKPVFLSISTVLTSEDNMRFDPPKIDLAEEDEDLDDLDYEMTARFHQGEENEDDEEKPAWLDSEEDEDEDVVRIG